jgi:Spy/CpxP family protein refolding chaperone
MLRTMVGRLVCWTTLVSAAIVFATIEQPVLRADGPVKKAMAKRGRRALPAHYAHVVTDEQREKILKIQDEYDPQIAELKAKIKALTRERDDKITAVLTPEQKKQVEEAKAKAKQKQSKPKAAKPAEDPPAVPPADPKPAK